MNSVTEANLSAWVKEIAVKGVHKEVHRTQFVRLSQKQGQSLNAYYGSLKAEASLCDFRVSAPSACTDEECTCANHGIQISYTDDMVATQLVAGLYNSDHQIKGLSEFTNFGTLNAKFQRLLVLEKSDTSLSSLANNDAFAHYTGKSYHKSRGFESRMKDNQSRDDKWSKQDKDKESGARSRDNCSDCRKQHAQCKICNGYYKCTTRCDFRKKSGHIKNCYI